AVSGLLSIPGFGQAPGLIGGVARDVNTRKPVADVLVLAKPLDKGAGTTTSTNAGGIFTFTSLAPGHYEITGTKEGFQRTSVRIKVTSSQTTRVDLQLQPLETAAQPPAAPLTDRERQLLTRIDRLEARLAAMEARENPAPESLVASLTPAPAPAKASAP